MFKWE